MRNREVDGAITLAQVSIVSLLDSGCSRAEIAERLNMSAAVVGRQISRIRAKVKLGTYDPPPLPIEAALTL
jgi:DNA-binding NarL/FixJ family response regulator